MPALSPAAVAQALEAAPGWQLKNEALSRTFTFNDFGEAMSFVQSVATLAERAGHHPDIDIRYNKVTLALSTHDEGGITNKDFSLAAEISKLL